jgi:hypothetical protein
VDWPPDLPKVYADFNGLIKAHPYIVPLRARGTREDLERQGLDFEEGLRVLFYDEDGPEPGVRDDLQAIGVMTHHDRWGWVGLIEGEIRSESEWRSPPAPD